MHPAQSTVLRRWFFAVTALIAVVLVLIRFFVLPSGSAAEDWQQTTADMLDNLLAATLTSLLAGIAYVLFFPPESSKPLEVVQGRDIAELLSTQARTANTWQVRARTASYFSRVTLPQLKDNALRRGASLDVKILVLDPTDNAVLDAYARFRNNHQGAVWTVERARTEIYSTILAAAVYRNEAPRMNISVALSPSSWMLSLDISDQAITVTGQNKGEPCLSLTRHSELYEQWRDEFEATYEGSRVLEPTLPDVRLSHLDGPSHATLVSTRDFFESLGLPVGSDESLETILNFRRRRHNYA